MKTKKLLTIIILTCVLTGCKTSSSIETISSTIGIGLSENVLFEYEDTHGGFHGDGTTFAKITFEADNNDALVEIQGSNVWNELPLSENLQLIMYGGKKNSVEYSYDLAESVGIPKIKNGYWVFIDRHDSNEDIMNDSNLFDRNSFNFTLAIYDKDNSILYYYEFDT